MTDDTPVSSTVSGPGREESALESSALTSERGGPESGSASHTGAVGKTWSSSPSAAPSELFEPPSEGEELEVDSGWAVRPPPEAQAEREPGRAVRAPLPRLELAEPGPPVLLYEKAQDPSDDSPILYCERGYVVDSLLSDEELAEHLLAELGSIREGWRDRDSSQFVQLASFDHAFETEPQFPPLATLSWKDWQGRTEIWVRGVRRSGPPPIGEELIEELEEELDAPDAEVAETGAGASGRVRAEPDQSTRSADSGTSWQSPNRSGEYPIPSTEEEPSAPPPSSQRVLAGEELMGALFERMNELSYMPDVRAGATYVLETLEEFIPCSGINIHVLDAAECEFVLVRALGPHAADQLGQRQPELDLALGAAVREQRALRVDGSHGPLWRSLGLDIAHALCAPVQQRGYVFGALELGRSAGEGEFSDSQLKALEFIGEQFAEFLSDRPFQVQDF